jgi:hypothetical protein
MYKEQVTPTFEHLALRLICALIRGNLALLDDGVAALTAIREKEHGRLCNILRAWAVKHTSPKPVDDVCWDLAQFYVHPGKDLAEVTMRYQVLLQQIRDVERLPKV